MTTATTLISKATVETKVADYSMAESAILTRCYPATETRPMRIRAMLVHSYQMAQNYPSVSMASFTVALRPNIVASKQDHYDVHPVNHGRIRAEPSHTLVLADAHAHAARALALSLGWNQLPNHGIKLHGTLAGASKGEGNKRNCTQDTLWTVI